MGVEHKPTLRLRMIEGVADQRVAMMGQMDTDLMGSASLELAFDQGSLSKLLEPSHMSLCKESFSGVDQPFPAVMTVAANFVFIDKLFAWELALDQSPIFAADFSLFQQSIEDGQDKGILGEEDGTAGFFIQPVNDIAGLTDIGGNMIEQSQLSWLISVGFHTLRFIDDDEVLVLVELFYEFAISK